MCFLLLLALLLHLGFQVTPEEDLQLQDQQLGQEVKKVCAFCFC